MSQTCNLIRHQANGLAWKTIYWINIIDVKYESDEIRSAFETLLWCYEDKVEIGEMPLEIIRQI